MKRVIYSRFLALILVLIMGISLCACSQDGGQKALSLESGWFSLSDSMDNAKNYSKGFTDNKTEPVMLSELTCTSDTAIFCSNTFEAALSVENGESVVLDIYDALGDITLWLNGNEIAAYNFGAGRFSFDVTKQIKESGKNTLVIAAAPAGDSALVSPGSLVDITVHGEVSISDVYTVSDTENKVMNIYAVVNNSTSSEKSLTLKADIASVDNNTVSANVVKNITVPSGESTVEFSFDASNFIEWSNENPFLYMLNVELGDEKYSDYVGYKSFVIDENATFLINGKPIMIKAADISADEGYAKNLYEILNYIKVAGFNTVHVGDGVATERLLEYCDRLGLLVYEGATETSVELAKRDRRHVSLCLADNNISAWKDASAAVVVLGNEGASNYGESDYDVKLSFLNVNPANSADADTITGITTVGEPLFIKSVGITGLKDNAVNAELISDWYNGYCIDAVMALGNIDNEVDEANVNENSILLDYVRAKKVSGFCFTTDISRFKPTLTEKVNDDLNDLRFTILTDKTNAFDTDSVKLNISLANFGVLTEGKYNVLVKITGDNGPVYKKNVDINIDANTIVQSVLSETVSLAGIPAGEYTVSAEFVSGAHAVCGDKTILVHSKASLPKVSGKVYTLGVAAGIKPLLTEQGATVEEYKGSGTGTIIIGAQCTDTALMEKAYESGNKVIVLGAQNKEALPVEGEFVNTAYVPVLHNSALTKGMENTSVIYEAGIAGDILGDSFFASSEIGEYAVSAFAVNADGSVNAGAMFALYDKYVISTMEIEGNISNPYAALMLLNAIK